MITSLICSSRLWCPRLFCWLLALFSLCLELSAVSELSVNIDVSLDWFVELYSHSRKNFEQYQNVLVAWRIWFWDLYHSNLLSTHITNTVVLVHHSKLLASMRKLKLFVNIYTPQIMPSCIKWTFKCQNMPHGAPQAGKCCAACLTFSDPWGPFYGPPV